MLNRSKKVLCVNLGYCSGCVYYANNIIKYLRLEKEVWISSSCIEPYEFAEQKLRITPGKLNFLWQSLLFLPWYIVKLFTLILFHKYNSVIVFGPHGWDFIFLMLFRLCRRRAYYVVHDGIMHKGDDDIIHQKLLVLAMKIASNHIFLSHYVQTLVTNKLCIIKPYIIIPHGIISYSNNNEPICEYKQKPVLLMIGGISHYKGINLLIESLPLLNFDNIGEIIIAGKFAVNVSQPDISTYAKVKIINKYLSSEEFDTFVRKSDFILMPYWEATQSGVAAVSIGYAKPAIVTKVGAMEEQFGTAAYYIESLTSIELANAIHFAISDPQKYMKIRSELKDKCDELSWSSLSQKLSEYICNK